MHQDSQGLLCLPSKLGVELYKPCCFLQPSDRIIVDSYPNCKAVVVNRLTLLNILRDSRFELHSLWMVQSTYHLMTEPSHTYMLLLYKKNNPNVQASACLDSKPRLKQQSVATTVALFIDLCFRSMFSLTVRAPLSLSRLGLDTCQLLDSCELDS